MLVGDTSHVHKGLETKAAWDRREGQNHQMQKLASTSVARLLSTFLGQLQTLTLPHSPDSNP